MASVTATNTQIHVECITRIPLNPLCQFLRKYHLSVRPSVCLPAVSGGFFRYLWRQPQPASASLGQNGGRPNNSSATFEAAEVGRTEEGRSVESPAQFLNTLLRPPVLRRRRRPFIGKLLCGRARAFLQSLRASERAISDSFVGLLSAFRAGATFRLETLF